MKAWRGVVVGWACLVACRPFDTELEATRARIEASARVDGGSADAGLTDAGAPDAGSADAGGPDAGADAGVDAGPRCTVGAPVSPTTPLTLSATAAPAVGSILNGFLVGAPQPSAGVRLYKFDGANLFEGGELGCGGACLGVHLPRVVPPGNDWAGVAWSSTAAFRYELQIGGAPQVGSSSSVSCSTVVNADVLHRPDASVSITGCATGFTISDGTTTTNGSSDTREVRASQNENGQAWLAYATATNVRVAQLDLTTLLPDNASPALVPELLGEMALDVSPDGTWYLAGRIQPVQAMRFYRATEDGGAVVVPLPSTTFPEASLTAPLGVAAGDGVVLVAFQAAGQGVYVMPWRPDGGWEPTLLVSSTGARPAIAADRTGFLVGWVEGSSLRVAPVTCE